MTDGLPAGSYFAIAVSTSLRFPSAVPLGPRRLRVKLAGNPRIRPRARRGQSISRERLSRDTLIVSPSLQRLTRTLFEQTLSRLLRPPPSLGASPTRSGQRYT